MLKVNRLIFILISLILILLLTSCGGEEQKTLKPQEEPRTKINYETKVSQFDNQVKDILATINLKEKDQLPSKSVAKIKKTEKYQFDWSYSTYKCQVPLYGEDGILLPKYRREIIDKFKSKFDIVDFNWQDKENRKLVLDLGFKAKNEFKLITHQLIFIQPQPKAKMAIIIDDFGFNRRGTKEILSINRPLTAAILPFRPHSNKDAKLAKEAGLEVLLHQPLEPMSSAANPGAGAIYTDMQAEKIKKIFLKNLNSLPQLSGINHHMGSKASANKRVMNELMEIIKEKDLFYIDSSTSKNSVGAKVARANDVPTIENHLFIDNVNQQAEIEKMILRLAHIALEKEELLIIGHVKKNTAQAIRNSIPELEAMGIKLVYASQIVK